MYRLIKAEIYTLFKTRAFKVLCIIALSLLFNVNRYEQAHIIRGLLKSGLKGMTEEQQGSLLNN